MFVGRVDYTVTQVRIVCGTSGVFSSSGFSRHLQRHFRLPNALSIVIPLLPKILSNLA